jgi:hypothetical protein
VDSQIFDHCELYSALECQFNVEGDFAFVTLGESVSMGSSFGTGPQSNAGGSGARMCPPGLFLSWTGLEWCFVPAPRRDLKEEVSDSLGSQCDCDQSG